MKIEWHLQPRGTLVEFADEYNLTMVIRERDPDSIGRLARYFASFRYSEVKDGCMLISDSGNGNTPEQAMSDYARKISGKLLVVDAMNLENRREIRVPILTHAAKNGKEAGE